MMKFTGKMRIILKMNLFVPEFFCVSFFSDMVDFVYGRLYTILTISQKLKVKQKKNL